jgi:MFS family permease
LWFDRRRGLFLGIVAAGIGLGFMTMPVLMNFLLNIVGWRGAYIGIGAVILLVIFPIILLFVRDDPADVGLKPDGRDQEKVVASASSNVGMSLSEAMKTRSFWTLLVITFVFAFVFNGMTVHFLPLLKDNGMEASQAVFIAAIIGMSMFVSRIVIGYLLDKFFAPRLAIVVFLIGAGGIALVASNLSVAMSILAAAMIGIGVGAETDIVSYMTSRYFGLRSFGKIYGFLFSFFYIGTGLGPLVLGIAYEANASYTSTLYQFTGLCVIIILAFLSFGPYKYQQNEALENSDNSSAGI